MQYSSHRKTVKNSDVDAHKSTRLVGKSWECAKEIESQAQGFKIASRK